MKQYKNQLQAFGTGWKLVGYHEMPSSSEMSRMSALAGGAESINNMYKLLESKGIKTVCDCCGASGLRYIYIVEKDNQKLCVGSECIKHVIHNNTISLDVDIPQEGVKKLKKMGYTIWEKDDLPY